jgi:hypothetical protein
MKKTKKNPHLLQLVFDRGLNPVPLVRDTRSNTDVKVN